MKKILFFLIASIFLAGSASASTTLLFEDFEDSTITYTTSGPEFTDGSGDFFIRTNGSAHGSFVNYSNIQGTSYFAGMDLDGEGAALPLTMTFAGIDISSYSDLSFSAFFAEDDDGTNQDWDASDHVKIEYSIDGGAFQNLMAFENDGSTYNSAPFQDTDFDGTGDGIELIHCFSMLCADITGTGDTLDLRFIFQLNAGDEDIAIDNVKITGIGTPVPVPGAILLLGSGLLTLAGVRRKRA